MTPPKGTTLSDGNGCKVTLVGPIAKWIIGGLCTLIILLITVGGKHLSSGLKEIKNSGKINMSTQHIHEMLDAHPMAEYRIDSAEKRLDEVEEDIETIQIDQAATLRGINDIKKALKVE